ncbi:unnamed protein product [Ambrosiozyma monospora]|uniref:Unnamed protein product n=1 Tax=Ambrosiozyma monospora TaxID=43982 RepID=A0A9W6T858_AMBMO|nr:unnamed protein product [Ambrosiozyma monospora]
MQCWRKAIASARMKPDDYAKLVTSIDQIECSNARTFAIYEGPPHVLAVNTAFNLLPLICLAICYIVGIMSKRFKLKAAWACRFPREVKRNDLNDGKTK